MPLLAHTKKKVALRVNALEMIATLAVMSTANITEKAHLVFQVFDLQTQGELTYDETVVMLICTLSGLVKVSANPALSW